MPLLGKDLISALDNARVHLKRKSALARVLRVEALDWCA